MSQEQNAQSPSRRTIPSKSADPDTFANQPSNHGRKNREAPFICIWEGCTHDGNFLRKSDFNKHMDKHRRPYTCSDPSCNSIDFGDKAGVRRHEQEKHGTLKHLCPNNECRRHVKGFSRKRNRDLHLKTCRKAPGVGSSGDGSVTLDVKSPQSPNSNQSRSIVDKEEKETASVIEKNGLLMKLRQAEIEEDIRALKRAILLVTT